jgi:hypothetical protein
MQVMYENSEKKQTEEQRRKEKTRLKYNRYTYSSVHEKIRRSKFGGNKSYRRIHENKTTAKKRKKKILSHMSKNYQEM